MAFMSEYQKQQMREAELRRFDRWFANTAMGPAYRGRDGRARSVRDDEVARWRSEVESHVDAMIAELPTQVAWALGALAVVITGGAWLLDLIDIAPRLHAPAIGLAVFIVEVGLFGIEIWDYAEGWRRRRDTIEAAVAARAPLPIEPGRLGSGRNWFQIALIALVTPLILFAFFSHLDESIITRFDWVWMWIWAVLPLAWGLHFASKWLDRRMKARLRR